ncbi:nuclear receptor subfamily 1 group I member 2 [Spea bombifrons]|uniref:nuclear receptor subfamily 1 group I member 2 n=1 Tax=Spea bombifrons TaxID=233779 RepID=UPI00234B2F97|nr:nuclear receptor subfamily 1 group I member 2 [Spea bombifrons]
MSKLQEAIVLEEEEEEEEDASTSYGTADDDDDGEPKICRACGDRATGYHFNAMTCEGCKGFFRRAMKRDLRLSCPFQNSCIINKNNRRHCQACRLKKCLDIGMKKEMIMSDEAVQRRRALIRRKQGQSLAPPAMSATCLSTEQLNLVAQLMDAHARTFDFEFKYFRDFRPIRRTWDSGDKVCSTSAKAFVMLPHLSDLVTYMIKGVIDFAKIIPYFRNLNIEDQIALLKGSAFELCIIRFNIVFNYESQTWECGDITYNIDDIEMAGFRHLFLEPLIRFHCMLKRLCLHTEEYVLMQAVSLFSPDRPGIQDRRAVDELQELLALTLMVYIDAQRPPAPGNRMLFAKIMECLTELRSVNSEHSKQLLQILDIQEDGTPLMREVFSKLPE